MIGKFRHVFDALRRERGEWSLFAVLQRPRRAVCHWDLVAAAPWLPNTTRPVHLEIILAKLNEVTTAEDRSDVGVILVLHDPADVAEAAAELLDGRLIGRPVGLVRRRHFDFRGRTLRRGYVWAANVPTPVGAPTA